MILNFIYSGPGWDPKPDWQLQAENELLDMIRAAGVDVQVREFIDDPSTLSADWREIVEGGSGWTKHETVDNLIASVPQDVFATLIFWNAPGQTYWNGLAYMTFEEGLGTRPGMVAVPYNVDVPHGCDPCTNDFQCVYGYIIGHEFYHTLEDYVKWKLLLGTDADMPFGDNAELCETIGPADSQGINASGCLDTPECRASGCAVRWANYGSKPCYQYFFDAYLPATSAAVDAYDYVEPPVEPPAEPTGSGLLVLAAAAGILYMLSKK